jgi:hypothetical protein
MQRPKANDLFTLIDNLHRFVRYRSLTKLILVNKSKKQIKLTKSYLQWFNQHHLLVVFSHI